MLDEILRPVKDRVLKPIVLIIGRYLSPNTVTMAAFLFGMAGAAAVLADWYVTGLVLWALNRIADGLDGAIAREYHSQTDIGGYLDILLDFTVYAALPAAFALRLDTRTGYLSLILLLAVFYINAASWMYLSALLEKRGQHLKLPGKLPPQTSIQMPGGIIGGTETIVFYTLFFLFPGRIVLLFILMAVLTMGTVIQRMMWAVGKMR